MLFSKKMAIDFRFDFAQFITQNKLFSIKQRNLISKKEGGRT